ncbi:hypothetical protein DL95DRAFT_511853 [Leptodontidium sp. 2 PMI_412]|nr:hypothetical protein DL95DRAFT_511853 [Leptodontidium sp. 2 PMI_412]
MLPGALEGRKKKRREQSAAVNPPDPRQSSSSRSSGSSGQLNDGVTGQPQCRPRVEDHVYASSVMNIPVNRGPGWGSTQQRSVSMDQGIGFGQNNPTSLANSFLISSQPPYPVHRTFSIQRNTNQTYFRHPRSPGITDHDAYREANSGHLGRASFQSQNSNDHPVMASPQWSVSHENRAREDSAVSPLSRSDFDPQHPYEQQDTQSSCNCQSQSRTELGLQGGSIGTDQCQMRPDSGEAGNCSEADIGVDEFASGLSALRVDRSDYRHPTSSTEYAYQDSLLSSSQSSRANSTRSTAGTYFSAGDGDQTETSPPTVASSVGSQQWGHTTLAAQYPESTVTRIQEPRRSRSRTTAFQRQVDIWQDGHRSLNAPAQLNNRTMLLDTQCQESNWVSVSIIDHLDLGRKTRRLSRPLNFSCTNGGEMMAREAITLTFRETGGVARTTDFFVASQEARFEILLGADDIDIFKMLVSNPPEVRRFFALVPRKQTTGKTIQR